MATCGNCGKSFSPNRGDARFCSNRCRLTTFREGVELATIVKRHLSFGTTLDGDTSERSRLRELSNAYPDAVRKLGEPLIRAAIATTIPRGGCRWDLAYMFAIRMDQPKPRLSRAGRTLLGQPCRNCTRRMRPAKQQPKDSGGATQSAGRFRDITSSARPLSPRTRVASSGTTTKVHDPLNTCTTCREYRRTHPGAALTAGGLPEGLAAHAWNEKPRPPVRAR
jgi:hypothetical protein